jgi:hypothetical protein
VDDHLIFGNKFNSEFVSQKNGRKFDHFDYKLRKE